MRICLISREYPPETGFGGIATFVRHLAHGLKEIGHEVEVVALASETEKVVDDNGVRVHRVLPYRIECELDSVNRCMPYSRYVLLTTLSLWRKFQEIHGCRPFDVLETPELLAESLYASVLRAVPLVIRLYTPHSKFMAENLHNAGTELLTLKVAQELIRRSYEVLVVTANPPDTDARHAVGEESTDYVFQDVPVHMLGEPLRLQGYTFDHEFKNPAMSQHFQQVLERFSPDILHIFHAQNLSASIIDCAVEHNVPVVCSGTDFWFVCPIVQLKRPDGTVCRGPSLAATNCLTCYTPHLVPPKCELVEQLKKKYPSVGQPLNGAPAPVRDLVENSLMAAYISAKLLGAVKSTMRRPNVLREAANKTRAIMVPTQLMRDIFVENGIHAELIRHVPFGIDSEPLIPYQQKTKSPRLRFGFIGTLFEHKAPDLLLKAFQKLPLDCQAELKIYGDLEQFPKYGKRLKAIVDGNPHNREKINFLGTFPNAELGQVFQNMDVLVVPSRWYENTPLVIQSALASKTPLIVTNLGGMAELVRHEFNGLVFELNNVNSLCAQMQRLLDEPDLLETMKDNIAPERSIPQMVDDIEAVYAEVLSGNGGPPIS